MNYSLAGSRSYSNLRDLRVVQPLSTTNCPSSLPENHYDVPRPVRTHRRSNSCTNNAWKTPYQENSEFSTTDALVGASARTVNPTTCTRMPSVSAPSSPILGALRSSYSVMSPRDQSIYNSLGSTSSKLGKPSFAQLGLTKDIKKTGIMSKTGPSTSWLNKWKRRVFVLKDNFLFYFDPVDKPMASAPVLGGVYIKDSIIERISLPFAKRILKITPPVPRRAGWDKDDESSVFFIKFRTDDGRNEWYEALMDVSLGHHQTEQPLQKYFS